MYVGNRCGKMEMNADVGSRFLGKHGHVRHVPGTFGKCTRTFFAGGDVFPL